MPRFPDHKPFYKFNISIFQECKEKKKILGQGYIDDVI